MLLPNQTKSVHKEFISSTENIKPSANGGLIAPAVQCTQFAKINFHAGEQLGCNTDVQRGVGQGATLQIAVQNAGNAARNLVLNSQPAPIRNQCMQHFEWGNIMCR